MEFNVGDKIKYKNENDDKHLLTAQVVDIWKNNDERVTGYFATLDSGEFVHILPDNGKWCLL